MISHPAPPFQRFRIQDFQLDCGAVLPEAELTYAISGKPDGSPPRLTCTAFTQNYDDLAFLRQPGGALDPAQGWTIHTELLGNGRSTSPSHGLGPDFPPITIRDNVRLQHALLQHLGVPRVSAVIGASMGGQQALQWAASYPDMVMRVIPIVASAKATVHVQLFLHALGSCIHSDPTFGNGRYTQSPIDGLSRMSEMWAPWAFSPEFFSSGAYQMYPDTQAADMPEFLAKWRIRYHHKDANDILCHLQMWAAHDVGPLDQIQLPVTFLPCRTDAYFAVPDIQREAAQLPEARVVVLDSINGHAAGFGRSPADREWLNRQIGQVLAEEL